MEDDNDSEDSNNQLIDFNLKTTKYLVINSGDRNWTDINNTETPYNYKVYFGSKTNDLANIKIPYNLKNVSVDFKDDNTK